MELGITPIMKIDDSIREDRALLNANSTKRKPISTVASTSVLLLASHFLFLAEKMTIPNFGSLLSIKSCLSCTPDLERETITELKRKSVIGWCSSDT